MVNRLVVAAVLMLSLLRVATAQPITCPPGQHPEESPPGTWFCVEDPYACDPGFHWGPSPDGGYDCIPDDVPTTEVAVLWPIDPSSLVLSIVTVAGTVFIWVASLVIGFYLVRRLVRLLNTERGGRAWDEVWDGGGMWDDGRTDAENSRRIKRAKARHEAKRRQTLGQWLREKPSRLFGRGGQF